MEEKRNNRTGVIVSALIGFIIGAVFGLVVLGWIVWPVQWVNATPASLDAASSQDYLRAAIDSYMVNQDAALANQRYTSLGEHAASTLAAINSNPMGQTPEAIQAFASAVGATQVLQNPPGAPTSPALAGTPAPAGTGGLAGLNDLLLPGIQTCLVIFLVLGIILFLIDRSRRKSRTVAETASVPPETPAAEAASPAEPFVFAMPEEPADRTTVKLPEGESTPAGEGEAVPGELPDWLKNAPTLSEQPGSTATVEAMPAEELPDWLKEQIPAPAAEQPEMSEEIPDWLQETIPQAPAQQTAFIEEPDWLTGAAVVAETLPEEEAPAEEIPTVEVPVATAVVPETVEAVEEHWQPQETREETHAKFSQNLAALPAMDAEFANRLRGAGVSMPLHLLKKGATADSRQKLAEQAGVDRAELDTWVNIADMLRVRGLTTRHALLLEGVGVHGVSELANADPDALVNSIAAANEEYHLLEETPRRPEIASWITQAKELPPAVL